MVWVETPTNPTMKLVDIAAVAEIVKKHPNVWLVVDNTFMSTYCQVRTCTFVCRRAGTDARAWLKLETPVRNRKFWWIARFVVCDGGLLLHTLFSFVGTMRVSVQLRLCPGMGLMYDPKIASHVF